MERHRLAWVLSLPLAAAGWLTAHSLAYRLVGPPQNHHHDTDLHGYLASVRPGAFAAAAVAVVACVLVGMRRAPRGRAPLRLFAIVPFAGFVLQEHCERLLHEGAFPLAAALQPTFLLGLALQVPFALAALLLARALFALGGALGRALSRGSAPRISLPPFLHRAVADAELPRIAALALGYAERGPPGLPAPR